MKRLVLLIAIGLPLAVLAQTNPVDKLFEKYANRDGFTTVNISGKLLNFASSLDSGDTKTDETLTQLDGIRILSVDDTTLNRQINFYEELKESGFFKKNNYEVLMEVTEKDQVVRFLAKDNGKGMITDLLLVVGGNDNALISIRGLIDPNKIGEITKAVNIDIDANNPQK